MKKMPTHLLIVSCAFLFVGFMALMETLNSLFNSNNPTIDFFVVFILIGIGLLRRNDLARNFAIACCMVTLIFQIAAIVLIFVGKRAVAPDTSGAVLFWLYAVVKIAISGYGLWALQSSVARSFFRKS